MAKANNERTEREFQLDVNAAVANTETEIFDDALGDEPLDNDGDTSLEEMGEGLEGDDLEEDEEETEAEADAEGGEEGEEEAEGEAEQGEEAEGDEPAEDEEEEQPRDQRDRSEDRQPADRRDVPLRAERDRRREAEERSANLERQLAEMNGRMAELSARVNAPPPRVEQPKTKPDQFADPEGWERWIRDDAKQAAEELVQQRFGAFQQQQQQERETRLNENLQSTAMGDRGFEFRAAYDKIMALDPRAPANQTVVQRMINSPDPGKAILDWFEDNGADEFRENIARQLGFDRQESRQRRQQPRHETRLPESLRRSPPSLNSARGGQRQETNDPEMMDDSDEAVARYAFRR